MSSCQLTEDARASLFAEAKPAPAVTPRRGRAPDQDLSDRKRSEMAMAHQVGNDPITGLANPALLLRRLTSLLDIAPPWLGPTSSCTCRPGS